jgi:hypothetical protein
MEPEPTTSDASNVSDELNAEQLDEVSGGVNQFRVIRPF